MPYRTLPERKVIEQAWNRAGGHCECVRESHRHPYGRCNLKLRYDRGGSQRRGGWSVNPRDPSLSPSFPSNCEILCIDCYNRIVAEEG